jgi:hypothetical protein
VNTHGLAGMAKAAEKNKIVMGSKGVFPVEDSGKKLFL